MLEQLYGSHPDYDDFTAALRKALGKGVDVRRAGPDKVRQAAADAARAILGEPPPQWPGFRFDPSNRFVTIQAAKDLVR